MPIEEVKPVEVAKEAMGEDKTSWGSSCCSCRNRGASRAVEPKVELVEPKVELVEPKVELPPVAVAAPEEMKLPVSIGPALTVLDLQDLSMVNRGELVYFKGRLYRIKWPGGT